MRRQNEPGRRANSRSRVRQQRQSGRLSDFQPSHHDVRASRATTTFLTASHRCAGAPAGRPCDRAAPLHFVPRNGHRPRTLPCRPALLSRPSHRLVVDRPARPRCHRGDRALPQLFRHVRRDRRKQRTRPDRLFQDRDGRRPFDRSAVRPFATGTPYSRRKRKDRDQFHHRRHRRPGGPSRSPATFRGSCGAARSASFNSR